jgi:hypothetical protein
MSANAAQLASALAVLQVRSSTRYAWLGQDFDVAAGVTGRRSRRLASHLGDRLYGDFFLTGAPAPASSPRSWRFGLADGDGVERLSAANGGRGSPEIGWAVRRHEDGTIVVHRDGLEVRARPEEVIDTGAGTAPGAPVALLLPKERRGTREGFYTALGDAGTTGDGPVDRLYWNVRPGGGEVLVRVASELLNGARLPFRLKTLNDPTTARRCDAAVLYTPRAARRDAVALAARVHARLADHLRPAVPALTLRLAPGLAFAEDPGGGESFGSHRCGLIVDAVLASWRAGDRGPPSRLRRVAERLAMEGIALDRTYLGPGARDDPARWAPFA